MSLADQVTNLTNDRNNIRTSLINKGITEAASHGFSSFDDDIDRMVKPEGTITVTENGTYDVTEREGIVVDVYTVTPIESPETDIGDLKSGGTLRVVWNNVQDAICYTVERKHGDNGSWQVVKTLSVSKGLINQYLDADVISGDYYYYRVYAISDGSVYGNSLSSNIASAMAPYGGGSVSLFTTNDFCEDITGGWIVEPYECEPGTYTPASIDPYTPIIDDDGNMNVTLGGTSSTAAIWVHTVNPIIFQNNDSDIFERLHIKYKRVGSATNMKWGVFRRKDDSWEIYYGTGITTNFAEHRFIFANNPATPYAPSNVPAGEYYVGVVLYNNPSMQIVISDCHRARITWDGKLYKSTDAADPEITSISGGYNPSDIAYYNPDGLTIYEPTKTFYQSGSDKVMEIDGPSSGNVCCPFITGNMIDFGGFETLTVRAIGYGASVKVCRIVLLDEDMNVVHTTSFDPDSTWRNYNLTLGNDIKNGGKYYLSFEMDKFTRLCITDLQLAYPSGG